MHLISIRYKIINSYYLQLETDWGRRTYEATLLNNSSQFIRGISLSLIGQQVDSDCLFDIGPVRIRV